MHGWDWCLHRKGILLMGQKRRKLAPFASCLLWLLALPVSAASVCSTGDLKIEPQWISTLEFDSRSNELLIADPKSKALLSYDVQTGDMSTMRENVPAALVTKIDYGFLLQWKDKAEIIGTSGRPSKPIALQESKKGVSPELGSLYSNWITRGPVFLGYGSVYRTGKDVSRPSRMFELGFIKGRVSANTKKFTHIELFDKTEDNQLYLLGLPYFAANTDGLFYVRMVGGRASVMRVPATGQKAQEIATAIPDGFYGVPRLSAKAALQENSTAAWFELLEKSRMIAGLFGHGKFLYLLTREPEGEGTKWLLHKIDPMQSEALGAVRLPTTANHLSIAVGPSEWYLVERGEVRDWGEQDIKTLIQVPHSWIATTKKSPLRAEKPAVLRCPKGTS